MVNVVGFQIKEIEAKKNKVEEKVEKLEFRLKPKIEKIEEVKDSGESTIINTEYSFTVEYASEKKVLAQIRFIGEVLFAYPQEQAKEILKEFKKSKKIDERMYKTVEKLGFEACLIETIQIAKMLKLPMPLPFSAFFNKQKP